MSKQHTPGPWFALENDHKFFPGHGYRVNRNKDGFAWDLAHICNAPNGSANARLIAAAPEMLSALRKAVVLLAGVCVHSPELSPHETYEAVSSAIAKATGAAQ